MARSAGSSISAWSSPGPAHSGGTGPRARDGVRVERGRRRAGGAVCQGNAPRACGKQRGDWHIRANRCRDCAADRGDRPDWARSLPDAAIAGTVGCGARHAAGMAAPADRARGARHAVPQYPCPPDWRARRGRQSSPSRQSDGGAGFTHRHDLSVGGLVGSRPRAHVHGRSSSAAMRGSVRRVVA
jgi:hypothetical protein